MHFSPRYRMNANALNLLTLLNTYQKKHLVEILSYHDCDSQTRNAPELDCLIRLQVQNIQQRHAVFLTGENKVYECLSRSFANRYKTVMQNPLLCV